MRYTIEYKLESPKQATPPDDSTATEWAVKPSHGDFSIETNYSGAFVQPNKLDFELSSPGQPTARGIRIGNTHWYYLNNVWIPASQQYPDFSFTPAAFCDALVSPLDLAGKTGTQEKVDSTDATHYRIEDVPLAAAAKLFTERSDNGKLLKDWDVDLWLNSNNRLVKVEATAKASFPYGREMSSRMMLQVGSYNDGDIPDINPPV